jgi:amino-acid N-acetyltransferase
LGSLGVVRKARIEDVPRVAELINSYARRGLMLPKSLDQLYQNLRDLVVVEVSGGVVGCGALHVMWHDLAEIRSLAVAQPHKGNGVGRQIVTQLLAEAQELGVPTVFALTYQVEFFERFGFHKVAKETLPRKIWTDCLNCPKFSNCDETALIRKVTEV